MQNSIKGVTPANTLKGTRAGGQTSSRRRDCVAILVCHCEFTTVNSLPGACWVAILIYSNTYEIASLITFARKDIATQFLRGKDNLGLLLLARREDKIYAAGE
jgi:hypothetical protein